MPFNEQRANSALNFFECVLKHTKGKFAGKPFILVDWQLEIIGDIFGNVDEDGNRIYQTAYVEVPKKNGKSELAAGIALYCLLADNEPGAEVYSAASSKDQAALVFKVAASMVEKSPALSKRLRVLRGTKTIHKRGDPDSFYKAISADGDVQDGINPHCVIADELHRWKVGKALDLWDILTKGTIARAQPLVFAITTAGIEDESPLCWRYHEYARQIKEGLFSDRHFYGRVFGADPGDDWNDPAVWIRANPSHESRGGFLKHAAIDKEYQTAVNDPVSQASFKRYHLNLWGEKENRWMDMRKWNACSGERRPLIGRTCYAGLDASATTDLTSLVLIFPDEDGSVDVLPYFWMPAASVREFERKHKVPYSTWIKGEFMGTTPGDVISLRAIREKLDWARDVFDLRHIAYDAWGLHEFARELEEDGFVPVAVNQQFKDLSGPTKRLMELVLQGLVRHQGHPVLKWNADCVAVKDDGNDNIKPAKPKRNMSSKRIDGIQALIMGLGQVIRNEAGSYLSRHAVMEIG